MTKKTRTHTRAQKRTRAQTEPSGPHRRGPTHAHLARVQYRGVAHHIQSHYITSQHVTSHHSTSHHIISHHVTSYHTRAHLTRLQHRGVAYQRRHKLARNRFGPSPCVQRVSQHRHAADAADHMCTYTTPSLNIRTQTAASRTDHKRMRRALHHNAGE